MSFVLDTYAWIEYFEGSPSGLKVKEILEDSRQPLFTPSIVLAELSDAVVKGKVKTSWDDLVRFVVFNTQIKDIDTSIALEAGLIKNEMRKKHPDFGLIDAIVLATSRKANSKLLTGDPHLIGEMDVVDIKKL
ncbi:MAG: PIN domain-containing protein [Candidatus Aenigmarchaeota archaeon]|nr:PIN domain-containing protein [Candidatus Aenigmarchaeota archaeon]